jgi:hypothetical protein
MNTSTGSIARSQVSTKSGEVQFQAAKRKARGYGRLKTIRTVIFLLAGKLDFRTINAHAA